MKRLSGLLSLHEAMSAAPHSAAWVQLNRDFHMTIYEASGHPRLVRLIRSLQDASVMAVSARIQQNTNLRHDANEEHGQLLKAMWDRDLETAVEVVLHHVTLSVRKQAE